MFQAKSKGNQLTCSGVILGKNNSPAKNKTVKSSGETCEGYWQRVESARFSSVVSKYSSGQSEKHGMVKCTCCSLKVAGKIITWNVLKEYQKNLGSETAPEWKQCEECKKFLGHLEEENETKLLGLCTECFKQKGEAL